MRKILAPALAVLLISSIAIAQQVFNNPAGTQFSTKTRGVPYILAASAVAVSVSGVTTETTLATISVPANAMGANGILRITAQWGYSGGAANWNVRTKFNGTSYYEVQFGNTSLSGRTQTQIANRNATNSQVGNGNQQANWAGSAGAVITTSHDTTTALNITLTGQLVNGADTVTLHSYLVELIVP